MKIAYVIHWNEGPESGVYKKIISQANEWSRLGNSVALLILTRVRNRNWEIQAQNIAVFVESYDDASSRLFGWSKLVSRAKEWQPDVVYHRFDLYYPSLNRLLRQFPSVLEINSNDLPEMRLQNNKLRYWYHRLTRKRVLKAANGVVFVSRELSEAIQYRRYAASRIVIGNGIALEDYSESDEPQSGTTRLVFIGSPGQAWHGLDKILLLAHRNPDWIFELIGVHPGDSPQGSQQDYPNVIFHGRLTREQYHPIMQRANVALGSLAMHRTFIEEASPLKVREYLAYGIPVIIGYRDTDFPENNSFILELPNEHDNVEPHLEKIRSFVRENRGKRVPRAAIAHLDTRSKENVRVGYMRQLAKMGEDD